MTAPPAEILGIERPSAEPARDRYVYYPGTAPVPEGVAVSVRNRSYKILANVEITDADAGGVIFAHGSRFGGHALFIKDHKLYYVYNFLGIKPEQKFVSSEELKPGKYTLGMEFTRTGAGPNKESLGTMKLYINDKVVAEGPMKTQPGKFTLSGDGLCIGYDSGDAVSGEYKTPGDVPWRNDPGGRCHGRKGVVRSPRAGSAESADARLASDATLVKHAGWPHGRPATSPAKQNRKDKPIQTTHKQTLLDAAPAG